MLGFHYYTTLIVAYSFSVPHLDVYIGVNKKMHKMTLIDSDINIVYIPACSTCSF